MGFATIDDLISKMPGEFRQYSKGTSLSVGSPGYWRDMFFDRGSYVGTLSDVLSANQGGTYMVRSHLGAIGYTNPNSTSAESCVIGRFEAWGRVPGDLITLYDRAWVCRGVHANTTATFNVASIAFVRSFDARNAELWMWINAPIGNTAATLTVNYIDSSGTNRTITAHPRPFTGSLYQNICRPLMGVVNGIQRVMSGALSAGTAAAGEFGFVIRVPKLTVPTGIGGNIRDALSIGLTTVASNECLEAVYLSNTINYDNCGFGINLLIK